MRKLVLKLHHGAPFNKWVLVLRGTKAPSMFFAIGKLKLRNVSLMRTEEHRHFRACLTNTQTGYDIPWTGWCLRSQPLQHSKVAIFSSVYTCPFVPWTGWCLGSQPLQYRKVAMLSSHFTHQFVPWTRGCLRSQPLQHIQMAMFSSPCTRPFAPWTGRR